MATIRQTDLFKRWFKGLRDVRIKSRISVKIRRLALGHTGDSKSVDDGVFELRLHFGPGYRVYYTQLGSEIVVLLAGGDKSTQDSDITKAKSLASKL